jgi:hypothetical protein
VLSLIAGRFDCAHPGASAKHRFRTGSFTFLRSLVKLAGRNTTAEP